MRRFIPLMLVLCAFACTKKDDPRDGRAQGHVASSTLAPTATAPTVTAVPEAVQGVIGEPLLAYLSLARSIHTRATLLEKENRIAEAVAELEGFVTAIPPKGDYIEVREMRADTYARLAELRMTLDPETASKDVVAGLALSPNGYFMGRLYEVSGIVDKARAKKFEEAGKPQEAKELREKALVSLKRAADIQRTVLEGATTRDTKEARP